MVSSEERTLNPMFPWEVNSRHTEGAGLLHSSQVLSNSFSLLHSRFFEPCCHNSCLCLHNVRVFHSEVCAWSVMYCCCLPCWERNMLCRALALSATTVPLSKFFGTPNSTVMERLGFYWCRGKDVVCHTYCFGGFFFTYFIYDLWRWGKQSPMAVNYAIIIGQANPLKSTWESHSDFSVKRSNCFLSLAPWASFRQKCEKWHSSRIQQKLEMDLLLKSLAFLSYNLIITIF